MHFCVSVYFSCFILYLQDRKRQEHAVVGVLVDFAISLMTNLEHINKESFQRFKLRVGTCLQALIFLLIFTERNPSLYKSKINSLSFHTLSIGFSFIHLSLFVDILWITISNQNRSYYAYHHIIHVPFYACITG